MLKKTHGFYIITTPEGRWGAYSDDLFSDWNSHLYLKKSHLHPLGKDLKFQFLGEQRVSFTPITFDLPKPTRNYGVSYCEECGSIYIKFLLHQRFCKNSCRINHYQKGELALKKEKILKKYKYRCASNENCPFYGKTMPLKVIWKTGKPYCNSCLFRIIGENNKVVNHGT